MKNNLISSKLALTAALGLALATFSCSSGGSDGGEESSSSGGGSSSSAGSSLTDEQVYYSDGSKYNGNAILVSYVSECHDSGSCDIDTLQIGRIQSGKMAYEFPEASRIASKNLIPFSDTCSEEGTIGECTDTFFSNNVSYYAGKFGAVIDGEICGLSLEAENNGSKYYSHYIYVSGAGQAKSYQENTYDGDNIFKSDIDWNISSSGWKAVYLKYWNIGNVHSNKNSTDKSILDGNTPKWVLYDDDCESLN